VKIPQSSQLTPIRQDVSRHTGRSAGLPEKTNEQTFFDVSAVIDTKDATSRLYALTAPLVSDQPEYSPPQFPSIFKENQQKAIDLYNITASISTVGGEGDLIGVDIYV
jgi:hypothetical protein